MFCETSWVRVNREKLSPQLTSKVLGSYRVRKIIPCFLHDAYRTVKHLIQKVPVVVQIDPNHWVSTLNNDNLSGCLGCSIDRRLDFIDSFAARVNIKTLQQLSQHEAVIRIWHDREIKAFLDVAAPVVKAPSLWNSGFTGKGIGVAILDTGIHPHPDLTAPVNRIAGFRDFVNERTAPYDDNGHGTHCAGDAAGNGYKSDGRYKGPAYEANLIGVKVLNKIGSGIMSDLLAGIQWCIANKKKYGIDILSMSLGGTSTASYKDDPLCKAVEKAWNAGIVVCVAAGNEGPDPNTISSPGIDPKVITVGASNDQNSRAGTDDSIADFSSRGPTIDGLTKPDVVAPGVNIISLRSPKSYLDKMNKKSRVGKWYTSLSGTSMATPVCAGSIALMLQSCPGLTPNEVKRLLMTTCKTLGSDPNSEGAGLINIPEAAGQCSTAGKAAIFSQGSYWEELGH